MTTLLLNIIFSSSITLWLKYGETKSSHSNTVTVINYLVASLGGFIIFLVNGGMNITQPVEKWLLAIGFAVFTGCLYLTTLVLMIRAIAGSGSGMCTLWNKAGILIPIFTSLILWGESPKALGWLGVFITMLAIFLVSYNGGGIKADKYLVLLMLCSGTGGTMLKVFQKVVTPQLNDFFVFCTFTTAFILAIIWSKSTGELKLSSKNIFIGGMVGLCNVLSDVFIMVALTQLPAAIVYPVGSSGTISLIALLSALIFKEKLTKKQILALILTIIGIILINI